MITEKRILKWHPVLSEVCTNRRCVNKHLCTCVPPTGLPKPKHIKVAFEGSDGILAGLFAGKIWVDHSTTDYEQTQVNSVLTRLGTFYSISRLNTNLALSLCCWAKKHLICISTAVRLPFTLSGVFSFPYVTSLIRIGHPQSKYQWKAYEIIQMIPFPRADLHQTIL